MLERSSERQLDEVFHALAHPVRREILRRVSSRERNITDLAEPFDMSLEAVSQHIRVLERAQLIRRVRSGRMHHCRLDPKPLRRARDVIARLTQHWNERLDALEAWLKEEEP